MREKNVRRAARALYMSQADDKNALLSRYVHSKNARTLVQDQGRALVLLEKLLLPQGKDSYSEDEMYSLLRKKLKKKGHRIQDNEEEDTPEYAAEKKAWEEARRAEVPSLFGRTLEELEEEEKPTAPPENRKVRVTFLDRLKFFFGVKKYEDFAP